MIGEGECRQEENEAIHGYLKVLLREDRYGKLPSDNERSWAVAHATHAGCSWCNQDARRDDATTEGYYFGYFSESGRECP